MAQVLKPSVRRQILKSARAALLKSGYNGCTMRQIAQGTNITVGNLYRYFDSKAAIYKEIVNAVIDQIDAVLVGQSGGLISLKQQSSFGAMRPSRATLQSIENGIVELVPLLVKKYRQEIIILLQTTNQSKDNFGVVDLPTWVGGNLDYLYGTAGTGQYVAAAALYAIEQILTDERDDASAIDKTIFVIQLLAAKGDKQ